MARRAFKAVDQRFDHGRASDAPEQIATDKRAVRLGVGKESTVLHRRSRQAGVPIDKSVSFSASLDRSARSQSRSVVIGR
jgi:hypothetical protein